jgi:DNA-directed RNA polymerase subunit omega
MPRFFTVENMNTELLETAKHRVPNMSVLINMVSKRVRQLISGQAPLLKIESQHIDFEDIALREIAEGKLMAEVDLSEISVQ